MWTLSDYRMGSSGPKTERINPHEGPSQILWVSSFRELMGSMDIPSHYLSTVPSQTVPLHIQFKVPLGILVHILNICTRVRKILFFSEGRRVTGLGDLPENMIIRVIGSERIMSYSKHGWGSWELRGWISLA